MKKTEVKQLFLIINNCYQNFQIDDIKTNVWLNVLQDIPFNMAQQNLRKHIRECKFPPTPADIINYDPNKFIDYQKQEIESSERLQELEAWEKKAIPMPDHIKQYLLKGRESDE